MKIENHIYIRYPRSISSVRNPEIESFKIERLIKSLIFRLLGSDKLFYNINYVSSNTGHTYEITLNPNVTLAEFKENFHYILDECPSVKVSEIYSIR